jgi:hypothetical protein
VGDPPPDQPEFRDYVYPELLLRGLSKMVPGLAKYVEEGVPEHFVDGGYYTKVGGIY